jgi:hypothetical protein
MLSCATALVATTAGEGKFRQSSQPPPSEEGILAWAEVGDFDLGGVPNDVKIWVVDPYGNPAVDATVIIDGDPLFTGTTGLEGFCLFYDLADGYHYANVSWEDPATGEIYYTSVDFHIGPPPAELFVSLETGDLDQDGVMDDVCFYVEAPDGTPAEGALIIIDDDQMLSGTTDAYGHCFFYDLTEGYHYADISWEDPATGEIYYTFIDFHIGAPPQPELYIFIEVSDLDGEGVHNDVYIYVEAPDGTPAAGANVTLWHEDIHVGSAVINPQGYCIFYDLVDGWYYVDVWWIDEAGNEYWGWIDFHIGPPPAWISAWVDIDDFDFDGLFNDVKIYVVDPEGLPAVGAQVTLNDDPELSAVTDSEGTCIFYDLPEGFYYAYIIWESPEGVIYDIQIEFHIGAPPPEIYAWYEIKDLDNDGFVDDVRIEVYDPIGVPIEGAEIIIDDDPALTGITDIHGSCEFFDLAVGEHYANITYTDPYGYALTTSIVFCIAPTGWIEGIVYDSDTNEVIAPALVGVWENASPPIGPIAAGVADETGYNISLPAGLYDLRAFAWGYLMTTIYGIHVFPGETLLLDIAMQPGICWISGMVYDAETGEPLLVPEDEPVVMVWPTGVIPLPEMSDMGPSPPPPQEDEQQPGEPSEPEPIEEIPWPCGVSWSVNGYYNVSLVPGVYDVVCHVEGYEPQVEIMVAVEEGEEVTINFYLEPVQLIVYPEVCTLDLEGEYNDVIIHVYDPETWMPIVDAAVYLNGMFVNVTNEFGELEIYNLPSDWYEVVAIAPDGRMGFTEFTIGIIGEVIWVEIFKFDDDGDGLKDDVVVYVFDPDGNPVPFAEVYIDGEFKGLTDMEGSVLALDFDEGVHYVDVFVYVEEWDVTLYAYAEFMIGAAFIYAEAFVTNLDEEGDMNDVIIYVYTFEGEPLAGAEVYINDFWAGITNPEGELQVLNLDPGWYWVDVFKWVPEPDIILHAHTEFHIGTAFMYADAFVTTIDTIGELNDVEIYVFSAFGEPVENAEVYINDVWIGLTNDEGVIADLNLDPGWYWVDAYKWIPQYDVILHAHTEFMIGAEFMYAEAFVIGVDVEIYVYYHNGTPVEGAEVYIDGLFYGLTNASGIVVAGDFDEGWHFVDVFKWVEEHFEVYYAYTEFLIGAEFMYAEALVLDADGDGAFDDVLIYVSYADGEPVEGAEVYIDDLWTGITDENGSLEAYDFDEGWHFVDVFLYVEVEEDEDEENFTIELYAYAEFYIVPEIGYIWVEAFVLAADEDEYANDVKIKAYTGDDEPLADADVFIDGFWVGLTDENGELMVYDNPPGWHEVIVIWEAMFGVTWFYSYGFGEQYIYIETYIKAVLPDVEEGGLPDDLIIYVYNQLGLPVQGAEVYIDGIFVGLTTIQGYLLFRDLPQGYHFIDVYYYDEAWDVIGYAWAEVLIGEEFYYGDAYVDDEDADNYTDDVDIWVFDDEGNPLDDDDYNVSIDDEPVEENESESGTGSRAIGTDKCFTVLDLPAGIHYVKVEILTSTRAGETFTFTFISEGKGESYIYAKAFTVDADGDDAKDDVRIYVYDYTNQPVADAEIYVDGELMGVTNAKGYIELLDITAMDFETGVHIGSAEYEGLKCGIGRPFEEYVPPVLPPIPKPKILTERVTIGEFTVPIRWPETINISIVEATEPGIPPEGMVSIGVYIDITADRALETDEWVYISVEYTDENLPADADEETLAMYYWDTESSSWIKCTQTDVDPEANVVWANVTHLTIFAPMAQKKVVEEEREVPPEFPTIMVIIALIIVVVIIIGILGYLRWRAAGGKPPVQPVVREEAGKEAKAPELKEDTEGYSRDEPEDEFLDEDEEEYHKGFLIDEGRSSTSKSVSHRRKK